MVVIKNGFTFFRFGNTFFRFETNSGEDLFVTVLTIHIDTEDALQFFLA